jgi:hypothetical protein
MTTITEAQRKIVKKIIKEKIDVVKGELSSRQDDLARFDASKYDAEDQESLYKMSATDYQAMLQTQINAMQTRKTDLQTFVDWLNEQVIV